MNLFGYVRVRIARCSILNAIEVFFNQKLETCTFHSILSKSGMFAVFIKTLKEIADS